jgi:hypothetical protein
MKPKIHLETTIPSYLASKPSRDVVVAAHQQVTWDWWSLRRKRFDLFGSQLVLDEAGKGDKKAAAHRLAFLSDVLLLDITDDVVGLAEAILSSGVIPVESATDAAHIAVAAVHGMDFLLTWNCAHSANAAIRRDLHRVCEEKGFSLPVLCTPEELLED